MSFLARQSTLSYNCCQSITDLWTVSSVLLYFYKKVSVVVDDALKYYAHMNLVFNESYNT